MAGLKTAPVIRFFKTPVRFTDSQIAGLLGKAGVTVNPFGRGGFPPKDVFHSEEVGTPWVGSRVYGQEGLIFAFFANTENDPIFTAAASFSTEITGEERAEVQTAVEKEMADRLALWTKNKKGETWEPLFAF